MNKALRTKLLTSKKVLSVCMETTAGGRNYSGGLGALYGDTARTMHRLKADFMSVTPSVLQGLREADGRKRNYRFLP